MYRAFNIELIDAYLDIILEPIFKNKYTESSIDTDISKIKDKIQIIKSNMLKFPIKIKNEEITLSSNECNEYIIYCEERIKEKLRKRTFIKIIKGGNTNG